MIDVERVDFLTIPTRDVERARAFYHETLGLPLDPNNGRELRVGQLTLAFWNPESEGIEFKPMVGGFALRVEDVDAARAELEQKGIAFVGQGDTGVCKMAVFTDPDGNAVILHRRYAPYAR